MKIKVIKGDITKLKLDAIVNASNWRLSPEGEGCGTIHKNTGAKLAKECTELFQGAEGVLAGQAAIAKAYNLPAQYVIHTSGPIWSRAKTENNAWLVKALAQCYRNCLLLAEGYKLESIAFPSIGTGAFEWNKKIAAETAISTILNHKAIYIKEVILSSCGDPEEKQILESCLDIYRSKKLAFLKVSSITGNPLQVKMPRFPLNRYKWRRGQLCMFIDDRRRPSDKLLNEMPKRGEICEIREVLKTISHDTGEICTGFYLEGYINPFGEEGLENCYEAERFLPTALIEALLDKETSWAPGSYSFKTVMGLTGYMGIDNQMDKSLNSN